MKDDFERISYKRYASLVGYKKKHPFKRILFKWYVKDSEEGTSWEFKGRIRVWAYILLAIPINIIHFLDCMINHGIKEYFFVTPNEISDCTNHYVRKSS